MVESDNGVLLGFDPGGKKGFGWCIFEDSDEVLSNVPVTGISNCAAEAIERVQTTLSDKFSNQTVRAAGIDAPLFWIADGDRKADLTVRKQIGHWCSSPGGTVQHVNSLRGACLVQGVMMARLLRGVKSWSSLPITEAHPKAFILTRYYSQNKLGQYFNKIKNEHARDAAIAGYFAWIMVHPKMHSGWGDLLREDKLNSTFFSPIDGSINYWFPNDAVR
jgi:predicted nuclease with RNAse H fold